jgi:hypothetical protein
MVKGLAEIRSMLRSFISAKCWRVGASGVTGSSFSLQVGGRRRKPFVSRLGAQYHVSLFYGELSMLVWCSWRLDSPTEPLASSDERGDIVNEKLQALVGQSFRRIQLLEPGLDLLIDFSGDLRLRVFCDHLPGDPSFHGNWQIRVKDVSAGVGPGRHWTVERSPTKKPRKRPAR